MKHFLCLMLLYWLILFSFINTKYNDMLTSWMYHIHFSRFICALALIFIKTLKMEKLLSYGLEDIESNQIN